MNTTEQYKDKQLDESEMSCGVLPPDYAEWLDSLPVKNPEPEEMLNSIDFECIPF